MQVVIPFLSGYGRIGRRTVSLPRIDDLLNDPASRYLVPRDADAPVARPPGGARLYRQHAPTMHALRKLAARLANPNRAPRRRRPSREERDAIDGLLAAPSIDAPFA